MRYKFLFGSLIFLSCLCFYFFHLIYSGAKETAIAELNSRQKIHANQAVKGIEDYFENLISLMTNISESSHIINLDDQGRQLLDFSLSSNPKNMAAITRVNEFGKITYTSPYNEKVIGKDISSQNHVQKIFKNHKPVVSDVFTAVQGYSAIAVHVPIFDGSEFSGTLGVLVNFNNISKRFLDEIKIGETGYAWMTSSKGTELYCPVPGHLGKSVFKTSKNFPTAISMAEKMVKKGHGVTTYIFDQIKDQRTKPIKKHAVFMPVTVVDSFWSLVVASNQDEVLVSLVDFKNKIIIVTGFLLFGSVLFSYYGMKAWAIIREREERLKVEKNLKQFAQRLAMHVENTPLGVIEWNLDFQVSQWNHAAENIFGFTRNEALGQHAADIIVPNEAREHVDRIWKNLITKQGGTKSTNENTTKDGKQVTCEWYNTPLVNSEGVVIGIASLVQDVSEAKNLEDQLRQAHKMDAIGTLAGGIAHDFNNILTAVIGYAELATLDLPESSPAREHIEEVLKASNRAKELVQHILSFSRKEASTLVPVKINLIVKEAMKLLRASIPTTIEIKENFDPNCGYISGNPTQFHQVLMNLCTNSSHAMEENGGTLSVTVSPIEITEDDLRDRPARVEMKTGAYIKLSVCDTGPGISSQIINRIFDPYFTTKDTGKGSGMGLAVTHGIVKNFNGIIEVESKVGSGTSFHVYFPKIEQEEIHETIVSAIDDMDTRGAESILVVDDEKSIVAMNEQMLKQLGYKVTTRTQSNDALELFRAQPSSFDLVITDQTMPKMTGVQLAQELLLIRPDIPIILCTGYSTSVNEEKAKEIGISAFVMKPLQYDKFAKTIRQVLAKNK